MATELTQAYKQSLCQFCCHGLPCLYYSLELGMPGARGRDHWCSMTRRPSVVEAQRSDSPSAWQVASTASALQATRRQAGSERVFPSTNSSQERTNAWQPV
eukprot:689775-Pleurochrysis_carterae.AAC.1